MSWLWEHNELAYSETYHRDEPRNNLSYRPAKPKTKPAKTEKKPANKREAHLEKIELFACKICKKRYTSKAGYSRHYKTAHESGKVDKEIKKKPANISSRALSAGSSSARFICTHCGKELSSKASLDRHKATHDLDRSSKPKARESKKVTSTTTNIKVVNNVNYGYSTPNDFLNVAVNRFWN